MTSERTDTMKVQRGNTALAVKAGFWYVLGNFLVKGISFISIPIFTRLMSERDFGEFSNYAYWQLTLLIITSAELHNTLARAYFDFTDEYDQYVSSVSVYSCLITAAFYTLFMIFKPWALQLVAIPEPFVGILFVTLAFMACKQIFLARERTLYHYKSVAVVTAASILIPTLIAIALVTILPDTQKLAGRIYGYYVPSALVGLVCLIYLLVKGKSFKLKYIRYALKLSIPLLVHYLAAYLLTASDVMATKNILGAEAAASVSIAASVTNVLLILFQAMSGAITTWLMDNLNQEKFAKIRKAIVIYVAGLAVLTVGIVLVAPEIVWLLGGKAYADSVRLVPGLVIAVFIQATTTLLAVILTYSMKVIKVALFTLLISSLSIAAKVILLPRIGLGVIPLISIVSFTALLIINYFLVKQAGYPQTVDIKRIGLILLGMYVVYALSFVLYRNDVVRWILIGIIALVSLGVLIYHRKALLEFWKNRKKK